MKKLILFSILVSLCVSTVAWAQTSFLTAVKKQELLKVGKESYNNRCSGCHGLEGDGAGPGALMLSPKPRDFSKAVFKFKSTPIGALPTNDDLLRVLNNGIPGTSMPSFALVNETEKRAIVEYIKTFSPKSWKGQERVQEAARLRTPRDVFLSKDKFLAYARTGRVWFQELGCVSCHGTAGLGDGPSAGTLKDTWGEPILPANLQQPYAKRGYTIEDIANSIMLGVDGTPMPAHIDVLDSLEDRFPEVKQKQYIWELSAYVFYLRGLKAGIYTDELAVIPKTGIPANEVQAAIGKYLE